MSEIKFAAIVLVIAIIGAFGYSYHERGVKIGSLNQTIGAQQKTINDLDTAAKIDKKSDAVTDQVTASVVEKTQKIDNVADKHDAAMDKTEAAIRAKYEKLLAEERKKNAGTATTPPPVSEEAQLLEQRSNELSQARMDDLRSFLCEVDPTSTSCQTQPGAPK